MYLAKNLALCFLTVSTIHTDGSSQSVLLSRTKRQDQSWIWPKDVQKNETTVGSEHTTPTTKSVEDNPCEPYNPLKPDFKAPGRRISETKCFEYIWERKNRQDRSERTRDCVNYRRKQFLGLTRPNFAIGGRDALPSEFPHMGALGWRAVVGTWIFKCGASLMSSKFMLTAAHCSRATPADTNIVNVDPEIVRLGDKNIIGVIINGVGPVDAKILRIIVHPKYAAPKKYFDIALIELVDKVEFTSHVQPACLWNEFNTSSLGTSATLTGWGVVETATRTTSPTLQVAVVDLIDSELCNDLLKPSCNRKWCGIEEHQICAGKLAGGVDACQGDSGGPLQVKLPLPDSPEGSMHMVIGVTSFGIGCARPNLPGVYTRVSSFIDWIEGIVWPDGK